MREWVYERENEGERVRERSMALDKTCRERDVRGVKGERRERGRMRGRTREEGALLYEENEYEQLPL